jgi:cell wall-associated NlpC family hydrolase
VEYARSLARRSLVLAAVAATALAVIPGGTATAAPTPAEIERSVSALGVKLDAINEQYNTALERLKKSRAEQAVLAAKIKTYSVKTDAYEKRVGEIAAAAYRGGRPSTFNAILSGGSPDAVLEQMAALDVVTREQRGSIDGLLKAKKPLDDAKRKLDAQVAAQAFQEKKLRDSKTALNTDLAKWKALNAQLSPRASRSSDRSTQPVYDGPASGRGATVVKFAYAQLGKPYVFGADGPGSYDCSGLTLAAWSRVGVSLPHSAHLQYEQEAHVSKANLQPGDVVFFYSPISHNGIYVGDGNVIHAPQEGENVKLAKMSVMPFSGAARPS